MDFKINSIVNSTISTISTFKDHVLSGLSPLEKRVLEVAIVIFSCVTLYCVIRSFLKKKNNETNEKNDNEINNSMEKLEIGQMSNRTYELHGEGERWYSTGILEKGEFYQGVLVRGSITNKPNETNDDVIDNSMGKLETGEFNQKNQLHGKGKRSYSSGHVEEGDFKNGLLVNGTMTTVNDVILKGTFDSEGQLDGENCTRICMFPNGRTQIGKFINGIYQK